MVWLYLKNAGEEPGPVRIWGICLLFRLKSWLLMKSAQKICSLLCNYSGEQKAWDPISFWSLCTAVKIDSSKSALKSFPCLTGILDIQTIKLWAKKRREKPWRPCIWSQAWRGGVLQMSLQTSVLSLCNSQSYQALLNVLHKRAAAHKAWNTSVYRSQEGPVESITLMKWYLKLHYPAVV